MAKKNKFKKLIIVAISAAITLPLWFYLQHNESFVSFLAKNNDRGLCYAVDEIKENNDIVYKVLESNGLALQCVPAGTKKDPFAVKVATTQNPKALQYASDGFKSDKTFLLQLVKENPGDVSFLRYAGQSVLKDKDFIVKTTDYTDYALPFADDSIKKDVALTLVKDNWLFLDVFEQEIRNDKDILLEVLKHDENISSISFYANPSIISQLQPFNQNLKKIESAAQNRYTKAVSSIQSALYRDDFALQAIQNNASVGLLMSSTQRKSQIFVLQAVKRNGLFLQYIDASLENDKAIVSAAIKQTPSAWRFMAVSMADDKEIMLMAVRHDGSALKYASETLTKDKEVILAAVKNNEYSLHYASYDLQTDKDFVIAAMAVNNNAFFAVDYRVQNDELLRVFLNNGASRNSIKKLLHHFSRTNMRTNKEIMSHIVREHGFFISYVDESIFYDKDILYPALHAMSQELKTQCTVAAATDSNNERIREQYSIYLSTYTKSKSITGNTEYNNGTSSDFSKVSKLCSNTINQ